MTKTFAQAAADPVPDNATDFQPPTRNPQTAPGQIFPENPGLQQQAGDGVLENGNAQISVPSNPAPGTVNITEAKSDWGGFLTIALLLAGLMVIGLLRRRPPAKTQVSTPVVTEPVVSTLKPKIPSKPKATTAAHKASNQKTKPKKSKSQRKKRARH